MKLIIAGPRELTTRGLDLRERPRDRIFKILDFHVSPILEGIELFVSGTAEGVDSIAEDWAKSKGFAPKRFPVTPAMRRLLGSRAPFHRNTQMARFVGRRGGLLIVHDGPGIVTPGSSHMLETARLLSLQFIKSVSTDTPRVLRNLKQQDKQS